MTPRPIIIDTDPGTDDAIAILLALASPELEVLGLTAVAGNVPLGLTAKNARKVCELAGRPDLGVFAGCTRPLLRPLVTAEAFHGESGLGGAELPEPAMPLQEAHGVDWLAETLMGAGDGEITLCPLGPLTNIALAMVKEPGIRAKIREIVLMGGSFRAGGNVTPAAEFNIHVDPHAAQVVFTSGVKLTMMPLDVTHQARIAWPTLEDLRALGTPVGTAAAAMMGPDAKSGIDGADPDAGPLHDPCVIAYLLAPELFAGRDCNVQIEIASEATMGMTLVDWRGVTGRPKNCTVMTEIDAECFFALIVKRLGRL